MEKENTPTAQTPVSAAQNFAIPFAIIVAGLAIAGAVYFGDGKKVAVVDGQGIQGVNLDPVTEKDHIIGNPNAKVIIVEYSDFGCIFCKVFHPTMHQIMSEYAKDGKVAWVYRHFASGKFPNSKKEAEASECAAKQGGNTKFWEYTNKIFEGVPSGEKLSLADLPKIANDIGLDVTAFNTCLESGEMAPLVEASLAGAIKAGVNGTPHSFILVNKKVVDIIGGAQPYEVVKAQIDTLLK